jgi:hypothetical protein
MNNISRAPGKSGRRSRLLGVRIGSCDSTRLLISKSLDAKLSWREALHKYAHLATCSSCRHYRQNLRIMRGLIRCYCAAHPQAGANWRLSSAARERINKKIRETMHKPDAEQLHVELPERPFGSRSVWQRPAQQLSLAIAVRIQSCFCSPRISPI